MHDMTLSSSPGGTDEEIILAIKNLRVSFGTEEHPVVILDDINLAVRRGETLGIVGESGCGKSMLSLAVMGLVPPPGRTTGVIGFGGANLLAHSPARMRAVRGNKIGMVFQEPMTSLNPLLRVGFQIVEAMRVHDRASSNQTLKKRAIAAMEQVRIPAAAQRFDEYPHQLSGGMRQRIAIAMVIACEPDILIADEPTTALDVTVQAEILDLLRELQRKNHMAIILITHDLGVVAQMADNVAVMYAGQLIEYTACRALFDDPRHPYTLGLLGSIPRMEEEETRLLAIEGVVPPAAQMPAGCRFHPRCVFMEQDCAHRRPLLASQRDAHLTACFHIPLSGELP
ncbi:ABC transporter ATP-binding protein [Sodalis sp. dw_96]|uniref:ABC transporter ATP-binding protein n=1 Tax=Sodalis sp. dw_96 TaxID=2719794 RepID=UPI00210568CB|nr:ABC transporter ATP-binding protein [Sodalis sp. dw_96]